MLSYKKASAEDFDDFFQLRSDEHNVLWTGHQHAPDKGKLRDWYDAQMNSRSRSIFLSYYMSAVSGYLYIDFVGLCCYEISYGVLSKFSGMGFCKRLVNFAVEVVRQESRAETEILAWIAESNLASIKCITARGFLPGDCTEERTIAGRATRFRCYRITLPCI